MKFEPDEATWVLACTDGGLTDAVGEGAFGRGLDYAIGGKVIAIATADRGRVLMGTVTGNGLAPYQCLVTYKGVAVNGEPLWVSRCTCPVAQECKHAVATVLAARRSLEGQSDAKRIRPAPGDGDDNVVSLFGERSSVRSSGWRVALTKALGPVEPERKVARHSPSSTSWRAELGLQFEAKMRPASLTDSTPVQRIEVKPTKLMRTSRWSRTVTWLDLRSNDGIADADEAQQEVLRRFIAHHQPRVGNGQTVFLDELGPGVWEALREAVTSGITLMMAATPGEGVTLGEPAEVALGVHRRLQRRDSPAPHR